MISKPRPCCGCDPCCWFAGGFSYNASTCVLTLSVVLCRSFDAADLTLVVTGPSGVYPASFVLIGTTLTWTLYKPETGSWSAELTLDCSYTGTYTDTYTATVSGTCPVYCCSIKTPNTMTVNSSEACCSFGNGTYVLSSIGSCAWGKNTTIFSTPSNPCSSDACFTLTETVVGDLYTYYFHPKLVEVAIFLEYFGSYSFPFPFGYVRFGYYVYRHRTFDGCTAQGATSIGWSYRFNCEDGLGVADTSLGAHPPDDGDIYYIGNNSPTLPPISYFPCGTAAPSLSIDFV